MDKDNFINEIPQEIYEFRKNVPAAKNDNLYLCQSVDMDGNIVDTKIGMNLLTNYGFNRMWVAHDKSLWYGNLHIYLGTGKSTPSPESATLEAYISALGSGSDIWYCKPDNNFASGSVLQYDKQTHLYSVTASVKQSMWDYTSGSNQEYQIWELGLGTAQNQLFSHALIYDVDGNQTCIVKRPNTRLYITAYWTAAINVKRIQEAYDRGEYALINPKIMFQHYHTNANPSNGGFHELCIVPLLAGRLLPHVDTSRFNYKNWEGWHIDRLDPDNPRIAAGACPGTTYFFQESYMYTTGFLTTPWNNPYYVYNQGGMFSVFNFGIFTYDELPTEGYDEVKNIEYLNVYTNGISGALNNIKNLDIYRFHNVFGFVRPSYEYETYNGMIPCLQFDVESLMLYNNITKQWDIPVKFTNAPETYYNMSHRRIYMNLYVHYQNSNRTVRLFVNPWTHLPIKSFSNSGIILAATDEYWDTDTWELIPNLSVVPDELSRKRYYIIINDVSSVPQLNPSYDLNDRPIHRINPDTEAYELTAYNLPKETNWERANSPAGDYVVGIYDRIDWGYDAVTEAVGIPISSDKFGFFMTEMKIIYPLPDKNSIWYDLRVPENPNQPMDRWRKFITDNEDRIITFSPRGWVYAGKRTYTSYHLSKNRCYITTVGDKDTTPSTAYIDLEFSTANDNNVYHAYTFSGNGFLVAQRREGPHEAVVVDIYGDDGTPKQALISNCEHCYALKLTNYCVYMDTDSTYDNVYVFRIYDMKTNEVIDSFTIDDGTAYEVTGIWGWREFIYVNVISAGVHFAIFYDRLNRKLQRMDINTTEAHRTHQLAYNQDFSSSACDECFVSAAYGQTTYIFRATDPLHPILLNSTSGSNLYSSGRFDNNSVFITQIKRINDGKQLILLLRHDRDYLRVVDLGWIVDNGPLPILPYQCCIDIAAGGHNYYHGMASILNNGVVIVSGYHDTSHRYRIFWIPIECFLRMKIKGRTRHINAFNQPIQFSGKQLSSRVTNDWDLLVDDEDKPTPDEVT